MKNWHVPLYVRAETPPGHVSWVGERDEALHFMYKAHADDFIRRLNELPEQCEVRFHRKPRATVSEIPEHGTPR